MNIRPAISIPLPYLTIIAGRLFKGRKKEPSFKRPGFRFPRTLKFTKEGKRFTALLLIIGIAAINTGNNLLYLVVAMMLSLIIASGVMSESTLMRLKAQRGVPGRVYKNSPAIVRLTIENDKKLFSSYSFLVEEEKSGNMEAKGVYVLKLEGLNKTVRSAEYVFKKRGRIKLTGLIFKTRFPFGLFIKGKSETAGDEIIVYPSIRPVKTEEIKDAGGGGAPARALSKGRGAGLYGLRDYTAADDSRYIHWKASAKAGRLLKKEFEKEKEKRVVIALKNYSGDETALEEAIDTAASFASHFIGKGFCAALTTLDKRLPFVDGPEGLRSILVALALMEPVKEKGKATVNILTV